MRIYLDLLPDERKKEMRRHKLFLLIIYQGIVSLFPIALLIALLVSVNMILKIQFQGVEEAYAVKQSQKENQELSRYEDKFKEVNNRVSNARKFQKNHLYWSAVLERISGLTPNGTYLTGITTKDFTVSIAGKAKTRDVLLTFQDSIKSNECFKDVNTPLSNLVTKENVVFQIDFNVKEDCLKSR